MATHDIADLLQDGSQTYVGIPSEKYPKGRTYVIPGPSARMGMLFVQMARENLGTVLNGTVLDKLQLDDAAEQELWQQVMGCQPSCRAVTNSDEIAQARLALLEDGNDNVVVPDPEFGPPCGSTYDQMLADGVSWEALQTIGSHAFLIFGVNVDFANVYLSMRRQDSVEADASSQDAEGNAPAPANRQERRAAAKKAPAKKAARKRAPANKTSSVAKAG